MLACISPEQFDEWAAEYRIEPWGNDWEQAGTMAAASHNAGIRMAAAWGSDQTDMLLPDDFIPGRKPCKSSRNRLLSGIEMEAEMRARYGA